LAKTILFLYLLATTEKKSLHDYEFVRFFDMNVFRFLAPSAAAIGITIPGIAQPLATGADIPQVRCADHKGGEVNLAEATKGWVMVYFYPKADTPGCTKQACSLRDAFAILTEKKVAVYGVSLDDVAAQKAFAEKYKLPFTLLADKEGKVADAFKVPHIAGFAKRQAFLFKDGKLVWLDLSASTDKQADDLLAVIEKGQ
jgi:peroxiredoxin Q/BCP